MEYETLELWMKALDAELLGLCGLSSSDLPDADFWNAWNDEVDPADFAREMLEEEGFPLED